MKFKIKLPNTKTQEKLVEKHLKAKLYKKLRLILDGILRKLKNEFFSKSLLGNIGGKNHESENFKNSVSIFFTGFLTLVAKQ